MRWDQWRTILWLRWRLTRNQWSRFGAINEAAGIVLILFLAAGIGGACFGGLLLGLALPTKLSPMVLLFVWDGIVLMFLFFWSIGLLTELQRSESLDLTRLMHLPISLRGVFLFNYLASWFTPSILIALPGCLCLIAGLAIARGPMMLWLAPVVLGFFVLVTSWTYLLRGWLASLMSNPKHRRTVIVAATLIFVGLAQLPNLYIQATIPGSSHPRGSKGPAIPAWFNASHNYFPPFWVARAARSLTERKISPALLATCGFFALGGLGLFRAYRGTLRYYRGVETGTPADAQKAGPIAPPGRFLELGIPGIPEPAAAVALATLRSHLRAPEVKMALFSQVLMTGIFGMMLVRPGSAFAEFKPALGGIIVIFTLLGGSQLLFNQFGYDRDGYRAYVLAPISRRDLLLGKNLATFPFVTLVCLLILGLALGFGLIGPSTFLASTLMLAVGFLVYAVLGNGLSIIAPYRVAQGSLKATKPPPKVMLTMFLGLLVSPFAALAILSPFGLELLCRQMKWLVGVPVQLLASALLLPLAGAIYLASLGPLGRLLQKREQRILLAVTRETD